MPKRIKLPEAKVEAENQDLQNLVENYMRKSDELEIKENTILRQMEIMQSAVASLKQWNEHRKTSSDPAVPVDPKQIEEETRLIREETARIQEEIEQKIEENKMLREEVAWRKKMQNKPEENRMGEVECRMTPEFEPTIEFFQRKLSKLKDMQKAMKEESRQKIEENAKKTKELNKKIEKLEWELEIDRNLVESLKKKRKN